MVKNPSVESKHYSTYYVVYRLCSFIKTTFPTAFLCPCQVVYLHRDPTGKDIFNDMDPTKRTEKSENRHQSNIAANLPDSEKVTQLSSQLAKLEETVSYQKKRVSELETIVNAAA